MRDRTFQFKDIVIRKPCHESWVEMLPEAGGRFCQLCQKTVVDFSNKTETEFNAIVSARKPGERLCGRFRIDQIQGAVVTQARESNPRTKWSTAIRYHASASAAFVLLGMWQGLQGKQPPAPIPFLEIQQPRPQSDPSAVPTSLPINAVILDQYGNNIADSLVVTLIFPNGKRKEIITQRGFFHLETEGMQSTDKVRLEIQSQTFESSESLREYKPLRTQTTLGDAYAWNVNVEVDYEYYMIQGDYDPGFED